MSELQEQTFGKESVERSLGYVPASVDLPNDGPPLGPDFEASQSDLAQGAAEIQQQKDAAQRERESKVLDSTVEVRDTSGHKLPEEQTLTAEEAAYLVTGAREQQKNTAEVDESAELAKLIDEMRGTPQQYQPQPVEQQQQITAEQFAQLSGDEQRQRAEAAHAELQRQQNELQQTLQNNPALLAAVSNQVAQEQARATAAEQQYAAAIQNNAIAAMAHTLATFPELNGISDPAQLAGALHAVKSRDPARAAAITEHIARTRQLVDEAQRVQQVQTQRMEAGYRQWVANHEAQFHRAAAVDDAAYDAWSRNQGVSRDQQRAITEEVMAEFRRQGWNDQQINQAYNSNPAMRSFAGQVQMHQAAAYRIQQRQMANVRRTKLDRTPPHVQRPGSPVERMPDSSHYLQKLEKPGQPLSAKEAAAFVTARRNAARR
jgi:hypothetical protein